MEIKEWLLKKDDYEPKNNKERFVDKSILSVIKVLSKIKREKIYSNSIFYKINPFLKLIFTIIMIVFVSLTRNINYLYLVGTYFLLVLSTLDGNVLKKIISISIIIPILTSIVLLPSILMGNIYNNLMLILKVFITIVNINVFSYTTNWHETTKCLKMFFIPNMFIFIFDITIRYIYLLGEFSLEMLYALKLRSVGVDNNKYTSMSRLIGNLFLKSKSMGDEMYSAMECRGFVGEYKSHFKIKLKLLDLIYVIINLLIIYLFYKL